MIPAELIRLVEFEAGFAPGTIAGPSRSRVHVQVRTAIISVLRSLTRVDAKTGSIEQRFSLCQIGALIKRGHSTVNAALHRAERLAEKDHKFRALCLRIREMVDQGDLGGRLRAEQANAAEEKARQEELAAREAAIKEAGYQLAQRCDQAFVRELKRKVRKRNDMIDDDRDAITRARASIQLAKAINAARAAA